ncbi:MAG: radical SAM protein [Aquificaceae bacterium]|nr:radical SAM protein [Aquificaceae bacterium]MDW8237585.1 radical SAM protein [Aquificaceae bacterium]
MRLETLKTDGFNTLLGFRLEDGYMIESVHYGETLCVSSQVGCLVGCPFCASGSKGLFRNLSAKEIISQYHLAPKGLQIKRIAFAGIGEPLMNLREVETALKHFRNIGLGATFYTSAHPISMLNKLLDLPHRGVSISLHASDENKRALLVPKGPSIKELFETLSSYLKDKTIRQKKRIRLAYILIKGINDSQSDLEKLADIALSLGLEVNLLKLNPAFGGFEKTSEQTYELSYQILKSKGVRVILSNSFRTRPCGGCGTLLIRGARSQQLSTQAAESEP